MARRKLVVIGMLGSTLDQSKRGPSRWRRWRPTVSLCQHPDLQVDRLVLIHGRQFEGLARYVADDIREVSPETAVRPGTDGGRRPLEPGGDVRRAARSARAVSLRSGARGLPGPHHDRHAHRPDLHVPADRVAALSGAPDPDVAAVDRAGGSPAGTYTIIDLDLSAYDSIAARFQQEQHARASRSSRPASTPKRRVQPADRRLEQVAHRVARSGAAGRAHGLGQVAARAAHLRAQEGAAAGRRRARRGQLRDAARGRRDVGAVRPRARARTRARSTAARRDAAQGGQGRAVPRRDRRAGPRRAGDAAARDRGQALPARSARTSEVDSDFQLIAGTNRDLRRGVARGRFREDLLARINLWTFLLPGLRERPEDIAPNLEYELERVGHGVEHSASR